MIVDRETITEIAVHLKLASDNVFVTARHLLRISNNDYAEEHWSGVLDSLLATHTEISMIEQLLRALMLANKEDEDKRADDPAS